MTSLPPRRFTALNEIIFEWAAQSPDDPALITEQRTWSVEELAARIDAQRTSLEQMTAPGARVAVLAEASAEYVALLYAAPGSGRVLVPLNHRLSSSELCTELHAGEVALLVGEPIPGYTGSTCSFAQLHVAPEGAQASDRSKHPTPQDVAWIIFTSGSTGRPKGVLLTHESLSAAVATTSVARPLADDDVYLYPFPLFHISAYNVLHAHARRRPVVLPSRFDAARILELSQLHNVTVMSLTATMIRLLIDEIARCGVQAPRTLRSISYGAAPLTEVLLREAHNVFQCDFAQGYGMTELSGNAVFLGPEAHRKALAGDARVLGSAGFAGPGVRLRIVDESANDVAHGQPGEILVAAPQVCAGYFGDPATTASAIVNGWLHTGDIGTIDETGLLRIVDRAKDIVVSGGENVSSREVENAIASHPEVAEVAIIGTPDDRWGEVVTAVIVVRQTATADHTNTKVAEPPSMDASMLLKSIQAHVQERIAHYKKPRRIVLVDALPTNAAGKVNKVALRARITSNEIESSVSGTAP